MTIEGDRPSEASAGLIERRADRATQPSPLFSKPERGDCGGDFLIG
jgi:hypothetical protein